MKNITIFTFFLLISYLSYSQTYRGIVKDVQNEPIAFANVIALNNNNNELIAGVITNEDGKFEFVVNSKEPFSIVISFIGLEDWKKGISEIVDIDFGIIILQESKNELDEIIIKSKRKTIERKADRLIFNVQNSIIASGVNGLEALKFAPRIDPTSESLKVIGKSSTIVYVNGRVLNLTGESLNTYLRTLQSDNIKRVEVITSPSAKYDAEGNKAVVNIVLNKGINAGFDGSINLLYRQRSLPTFRPSTSLTYSKNRLSMVLNISYNSEKKKNDLDSDIFFNESSRNLQTDRKLNLTGIFGNYDINYQLSPKSNLGVRFNGEFNDEMENTESKTSYISNITQEIDSTFSLPSNNKNDYSYYAISTYYDLELDSLGSQIKINYNHLNNSISDTRMLASTLYEDDFFQLIRSSTALNESNRNYSVNSIKADIELIKENSKWEIGGKASFINNDSEILFFDTTSGSPLIDLNQSNNFKYSENILAAYLAYEVSLGEKVFAKVGLRYENTSTEGNSVNLSQINRNRFNNFFPSLFLSYNPSNNHSYSFGYSTNIDRPNFYDVNPFRTYFDLLSYNEGNPQLLPSYTHDVELSYTLKNNFTLLLYGSLIRNAFDYVTLTSEIDNIVVSRPQNYFNQNSLGIDVSYNWEPTKWFQSFNSINGFYNSSKSKIPSITLANLDGYGITYSTRNIFIVNKERRNRLYFTFSQNFPSTDGFVKIATRANFRFGGIFTFLDKNLILNISASDIFRQFQSNITETYQNYRYQSNTYNDSRNISFSVTYKIGNKKSKKVKIEDDDIERGRMK